MINNEKFDDLPNDQIITTESTTTSSEAVKETFKQAEIPANEMVSIYARYAKHTFTTKDEAVKIIQRLPKEQLNYSVVENLINLLEVSTPRQRAHLSEMPAADVLPILHQFKEHKTKLTNTQLKLLVPYMFKYKSADIVTKIANTIFEQKISSQQELHQKMGPTIKHLLLSSQLKAKENNPELIIQRTNLVLGLFMDKFNTNWSASTSSTLLLGLNVVNKTLVKLQEDETLTPAEKDTIKTYSDQLMQAAYDSVYSTPEMTADKIENLKIGEEYLVATPSQHHGTLTLVKKVDATRYEATIFNAGAGLKSFHPRLPQYKSSPRIQYQTHLTFTSISKKNIANPTFWREVKKAKEKPKVESLYKLFKKVGKKTLQQKEDIYYESIQESGSCSVQCIMAYLRYAVMESTAGNSLEKIGTYKAFKIKLFKHHINLNIHEETKQDRFMKVVCRKNEAEHALLALAADEGTYQTTLSEMKSSLENFNIENLKKEKSCRTESEYNICLFLKKEYKKNKLKKILSTPDTPTKNSIERYAVLRATSNLMFWFATANLITLTDSMPFNLASAKLDQPRH